MKIESEKSDFASAARSCEIKIKDEFDLVSRLPYVSQILDVMPHIVFVLNENRQIVYANKVFYESFGVSSIDDFLGLRPGEVLDCVNACKNDSGCGTSRACKYCGAVLSILAGLEGIEREGECSIVRKSDGLALELKVKGSPFEVDGHSFVILSAFDISNEKRVKMLENLFYHDVLNTAEALKGLSSLLPDVVNPDKVEGGYLSKALCDGIEELIEELNAQKDLASAFRGELETKPVELNTAKVVGVLADIYLHYMEDKGCSVGVEDDVYETLISTDKTLLVRVLGNLIRNGIEAIEVGEKVRIGCEKLNGDVVFKVSNPGVMDEAVREQIFKKSFSTKGDGRGMGTYSAKYITEQYLKGKLEFVSDEENGTVFSVHLPKELN